MILSSPHYGYHGPTHIAFVQSALPLRAGSNAFQIVSVFYTKSYICQVLRIAKRFNLFYNTIPVLRTEDPRLKESRVKLVASSLQVISNGLAILGIEIPVAM